MMQEIIAYLEGSNAEKVKLFFVIRNKDQRTREINYYLLKSIISTEVGEELKNNAISQSMAISEKGLASINYGDLLSSDRDYIEIIKADDVPYMLSLITATTDTELGIIDDCDFNNVWGYITRIENINPNRCLLLFKKSTASKLLRKGKLAVAFRGGQFDKMDAQVITLENNYDAAILIKETRDADKNVIILNRSLFEALFSFIEYYQREVENKIEIITEKGLFDNVESLIRLCISDSRKIKKLAKILNGEFFNLIDKTKIKESIMPYDLDIKLTKEDKIKINDSNIWDILRILDDDCVKSDITGSKYLAHSKLKI